MSHAMTQRVWKDGSLKGVANCFVMLALADCHNPKHGCFPSIETLMGMTRLSNRGVFDALEQLAKSGHIKKVAGGGRGHPNSYLLYPETGSDRTVRPHNDAHGQDSGNDDFLQLPPDLRTPELEKAWSDWIKYKSETGHKLTPTTVERQIQKIRKIGIKGAVIAINESITSSWSGLFEPRQNNSLKPAQPKKFLSI